MFCVFCGAENPEFASFCEKCGESTKWKRDELSSEGRDSRPPEAGSLPTAEARMESDNTTKEPELREARADVPRSKARLGLLFATWLIALLIFNVLFHWAHNTGSSDLYILADAVSQVTTPIQLLLSFAVLICIFSLGKKKSRDVSSKASTNNLVAKRIPLLPEIGVLFLAIALFIVLLRRNGASRPDPSAQSREPQSQEKAIDPNGLNGYEIISKSGANLGNEADGLTPQAKKRMREMLALELSGAFQKQNNPIHVEVTGDNHDELLFQLSSMNDGTANELIRTLRDEGDANFWNAMRLMDYTQVVFSGDAYKKIVGRTEFLSYGKNYESYKAAFLRSMKSFQSGVQGEIKKP